MNGVNQNVDQEALKQQIKEVRTAAIDGNEAAAMIAYKIDEA
jgi:hypothetical protein